jgi:hypothetical protein
MASVEKTVAWIGVVGAIAAAIVTGAFGLLGQRSERPSPEPPNPGIERPDPPVSKRVVMGPLERGVNRQGMDFSANAPTTANAELCAELCRTTSECKSMTYVISLQTCWLKTAVPAPYPPGGEDYVSAVKQE